MLSPERVWAKYLTEENKMAQQEIANRFTDDVRFGVVSDLYSAGHTEDGDEFIAEAFFVQAEDSKGNRWLHGAIFHGAEVEDDDGCFGFRDIREEATAKANLILTAVSKTRSMEDFYEAQPIYGSSAWSHEDDANLVAFELSREYSY